MLEIDDWHIVWRWITIKSSSVRGMCSNHSNRAHGFPMDQQSQK